MIAWIAVPLVGIQPTSPFPKKLPRKLLLKLVKIFAPLNVWLPLSKATLVDSRASATVPLDTWLPFRFVNPAPLPLNPPINWFPALLKTTGLP